MSYTMYTPLNVWLDPASVTDVVAYIQTYLSENTIYSETEIETIIHDYLIAHPELIGGVQSVNGKTGTVVLSASDINTENNVTIESVLASLSSQISSIAASVATNTSNITGLTGRMTTAETDLANLKSNSSVLTKTLNTLLYDKSFTLNQFDSYAVIGGLYRGVVNPSQGWRVSIDSLLSFPYDTTFTIESGYQFAYHTFVNGVFAVDSGWKEGTCTIPANTVFKCTINKKNSYDAADIETYLSKIEINYPYTNLSVAESSYPYINVLKDYDLATQIQDAVYANNLIYQFTGGGTNIGDYYGRIIIINPSDLTMINNRYHDLGHVSCLGYDAVNDVLFSGRIINNVPRIQIYNSFLTACTEGSILSPSDANCINIELENSLLDSRTSFDVTFGEFANIIYAFCTTLSELNNAVLLYKILLGTGTTDLSGETDGYGIYTSAADGEFNGTCKITGTWTLPAVNRQPQLIRWHKGRLYMMTSNHDTIIHKYKYCNEEFVTDELIYVNDLNPNGSAVYMEAESIVYDGEKTYIGLWDKTSPTKMRLLTIDV